MNLLRELNKFRREKIIEAKKDPFYKKLKREYKIPTKYAQYNQIILDVIINAKMRFFPDGEQVPYHKFRPQYQASSTAMLLELNEPSVYCLYPKLLEAIKLTDLPESFPGLEQVVPFGILLLPETLIEDGEKTGINYLIFSHFSTSDELPIRKNMKYISSYLKKTNDRSISWFAATSDCLTAYCEEIVLDEEGNIISNSENEFVSKITSILIQSLYFIQEETLVASDNNSHSSYRKFWV